MKYMFKPQTAILVAGVLAATYAEACWYQNTSVVCFTSGSTVDSFVWNDFSATAYVTATADWLAYAPNGHYYVYSPGPGGGHLNYNADTSVPDLDSSHPCKGPAQFLDYSSHPTSVSTWMENSTSGGFGVWPHNAITIHGGTTSGGTCN